MRDPLEGITADGMITTGVGRHRVPTAFEPVLDAAREGIAGTDPDAAVYLYGSVATGQARPGRSDVDLLAIGLNRDVAGRLARMLSARFAATCRGVEIGSAHPDDLTGERDEAYGFRVFLRHYCVHLAGSDRRRPGHDFPADARAARKLNGDIARAAGRWREALADTDPPGPLAVRVARKTLLAVAGLVSVHDGTWTTDRAGAARRWGEIEPALADGLAVLADWTDRVPDVDRRTVDRFLLSAVDPVIERFEDRIGLWSVPS